jgi:hypothetical protein
MMMPAMNTSGTATRMVSQFRKLTPCLPARRRKGAYSLAA